MQLPWQGVFQSYFDPYVAYQTFNVAALTREAIVNIECQVSQADVFWIILNAGDKFYPYGCGLDRSTSSQTITLAPTLELEIHSKSTPEPCELHLINATLEYVYEHTFPYWTIAIMALCPIMLIAIFAAKYRSRYQLIGASQ